MKNALKWIMVSMCLLLGASCAQASQAEKDYCGTSYEVFVYSFYDSNGDGIGDLPGLLEKLDYINDGDPDTREDLGCGMLWTMPVFPSPTYHKYDVTDYMAIDPEYGTMADFDVLLKACHDRGMKWILDLPLNHTSTAHPWFQEAVSYLSSLPEGEEPSPDDCRYVSYYNFAREPGNGWEQLAGTDWYYEARFWSGMPDLNLDSEEVRSEIKDILTFWLDRGVDGFRLDAVTSFYTENTNECIAFTQWLSETVKSIKPDCYLVGEAWTDQDTYIGYYRSGIDSMFDFAFSGSEGIIARVANGKRDGAWFVRKLAEEEELFSAYENAVNAPFYTNHDMARSAGYYIRDDGRRAKLAQALNLLMPGNAFLYYGEELGMKGSGKDENKRAPMYWNEDPLAEGMCAGPPEMEEVKMKYGSYEEQKEDPSSIYSYVRNVIRLKSEFPVIAEGRTVPAEEIPGEDLCAMIRQAEGEEPVLLVINISDETQMAEIGKTYDEYTELAGSVSGNGEDPVAFENGVLTLAPCGIAVLEKPAVSEHAPEQNSMILAHAGVSLAAPENTLSAFREAKELGADGFETDVRMTKDHHLVIHHDDAIDQTSDGQGLISEMTLEELKAFDYGSWFGPEFEGEEILTLEECLAAAKELDFDVVDLELKPVTTYSDDRESSTEEEDDNDLVYVKAAADAIKQSGFADHVIVTSFDNKLLKAFREYAPEIPVGIITVPDMSFLNMFNLSKYLPSDKPLAEYEAEDVKEVPGMVSMILKGFGAKGRSPEETLLEAIHAVGAATPSGTTYSDLKELLAQEADIADFVENLELPVDYINCHYQSLTAELVETMREDGIGVMAWTPDQKKDLESVLAFSPDGIVTNRPETALEIIG